MTNEMRAVGYTKSLPIEDPSSLIDVMLPRPIPGGHDLIVEVRAVSVNPVDVKRRARSDPAGAIKVLGYDAAGVVREVGSDVSLFAPGDEVFYAGSIDRPGANSEFHAVDERIVGHKPASLSFAEAAALPLTSLTAWEGLFDKLRLKPEGVGMLLVVGASGGVGSIVLQLAKQLVPGVRIVGTSSSPESDEWVRALGADELVNHRAGLLDEVRRVAPEGIDNIFTTHTAGQVDTFIEILKPFGQVVAIDDPQSLDIVPFKPKALSWHWEFMFARPVNHAEDLVRQHQILDEVSALVDAGRVRTTATRVLGPIDAAQLREAHRLVETGHVIGKVVVAN
jgi:zinc-binding alcohol dehydrogenase family protein